MGTQQVYSYLKALLIAWRQQQWSAGREVSKSEFLQGKTNILLSKLAQSFLIATCKDFGFAVTAVITKVIWDEKESFYEKTLNKR